MVTVRRTTLVVLLTGVAFLIAMLMFGGVQGGAANAAPSHSSATAKSHTKKAHAKRTHAVTRTRRVAAATQTAPETPSSETESSTEPAGEPADGYEDPAGSNAQHECPPACGPGEIG
jgi:hypothetical protein